MWHLCTHLWVQWGEEPPGWREEGSGISDGGAGQVAHIAQVQQGVDPHQVAHCLWGGGRGRREEELSLTNVWSVQWWCTLRTYMVQLCHNEEKEQQPWQENKQEQQQQQQKENNSNNNNNNNSINNITTTTATATITTTTAATRTRTTVQPGASS